MELKKFKAATAMATLGLAGIASGNAMANDFETNKVAYDGLKVVQQNIQERNEIDLNAPTLEVKSSVDKSASNMDNLVLPDQVLESGLDNVEPEAELDSVEPTSELDNAEPGAVDAGTDLESQIEGNVGAKSQQESCDRKANAPSMLATIGGWVLKGTAMVLTVQSAGSAVVPAHAINRTGDYLLKNGCDKFSISEEVYELGKTVVTAGMGDASLVGEIAIDVVKGKIDDHLEQKEKEAKAAEEAAKEAAKSQTTVVVDGSSNEDVIPEVSAEITSDKVSQIEEEPIILKIDRKAMQELGEASLENELEPERIKMKI